MKKLLLLLLTPLFSFIVADWVSVNLDDRVSVEFPATPEKKEMGGNSVWVSDVNPNARCMVMIVDFGKMGLDSAQVADEMEKEESFQQFKEGVLGQIPNSTLISEKKTQTAGKHTFEYVIDMGKSDTSQLNKMYNRNIFVGTKMYSMSFYEKNGKPENASREHFFKSFKLK